LAAPARSLAPSFSSLRLDPSRDPAPALSALPAARGVAQLLGPDGRSLLIGAPANLRRWAGAQLGQASPRRPGGRPRLSLRPLARELRFARAETGFGQRLCFERLMGRAVPLEQRRDLKTPGWIAIELPARFPRALALGAALAPPSGYGPFRDKAAAARARETLERRFGLRPCDLEFDPHPELPLGLSCVYAQVRSCLAPCLARVSEGEYGARARHVAELLAGPPSEREELGDVLPECVGPGGADALVVERARPGLELYPVRAGAVLDAESRAVDETQLAAALASLRFEAPAGAAADWPWLAAWLAERRRKGHYFRLRDGESPSALGPRVAERLAGGV
jgi:hypothetical protein